MVWSRLILTVLILLVWPFCCMDTPASRAQAEPVFIPDDQIVVQEKEYYGNQDILDVVLAEGIRRVESLAFAKSTLRAINLPSSLEYIAKDAFQETNVEEVVVHAGTYAFEWIQQHHCAERILIQTETWQEYADAADFMRQSYRDVEVENRDIPFSTGRILTRVERELPDLSEYHPVLIIMDGENHFMIQFLNPEEAERCCGYLLAQPGVVYAEADGSISLDNAGQIW